MGALADPSPQAVTQEHWVQPKSMLGCAGRGDAGAGATRGSRNSFSLGACRGRISHSGWGTGDTQISRGIFPSPHVKHKQTVVGSGFSPPSCISSAAIALAEWAATWREMPYAEKEENATSKSSTGQF